MNVREMLLREEARCHKAYPDPLTHAAPWTIGVGHTGPEVHEGLVWDDSQIDAAFDADLLHATVACERAFAPWFPQLNEPRQAVLVGMCFQMGLSRLMGFRDTLGHARDGEWVQAKAGMLDSLWARQTHARAARMAEQMLTGEWQ